MGLVATKAAADPHRRVFENERALLLRMTIEADPFTRPAVPHHVAIQTAVWLMAISARHRPFYHPVMKRLGELRALQRMAVHAQRVLAFLQKRRCERCIVVLVAIRALKPLPGMRSLDESFDLPSASVAFEAPVAVRLEVLALERNNL
jgi:hypothetical protein